MDDIVVQTQELSKLYGKLVAVDKLNMRIGRGEVFGLLGPNGAGKTTTILMLLGLTEPSAGRVAVLGFDPARRPLSVKARVGYLPDAVGFYDHLSGRENLAYIARLNGFKRAETHARLEDALAQVGLIEVADRRVATYSRGMRQRLGLADVLIKRPRLVIMDEPTLGLDPEAAREFLQLIRRLRGEEITVLLSSHLLHQVQAVCDRVGLFHRGKMVLEGRVDDLARRVLGGAYRILVEAQGEPGLADALATLDGVLKVQRHADSFTIEARRDLRADAAHVVVEHGGRLLSLSMETPSLDEIYERFFHQGVPHASAAA